MDFLPRDSIDKWIFHLKFTNMTGEELELETEWESERKLACNDGDQMLEPLEMEKCRSVQQRGDANSHEI